MTHNTIADGEGCAVGTYVPPPRTGWPCPPVLVLREIDAQISLQFDADPTQGTLVCRAEDGSADLTRLQEREYQALILIKRLEFDTPLPWTSASLWDWFTGSVRGVRFISGSQSTCCSPGSVINIGTGGGYEPGFPTLEFGFIHEARHAEVWRPHTCGFRASIADMGAFGVQYYLGIWIANHATSPTLTADERRYAASASDLLRGSAFCQECGG